MNLAKKISVLSNVKSEWRTHKVFLVPAPVQPNEEQMTHIRYAIKALCVFYHCHAGFRVMKWSI